MVNIKHSTFRISKNLMRLYTSDELAVKAKELRVDIIKSLAASSSGHTGASLGLADIFTALYFNILNHNPQNPSWEERDRLILSIGHAAPVLYSTLANSAKDLNNKPTVIIAKTIMGKGVKAIENDYRWHGKAPNPKEAEEFISSLLQ